MDHIRIRRGRWTHRSSIPRQTIVDGPRPNSAAFLGADFPGLRPAFELAEGDKVAVGQVIFRDRAHPQVTFVSPMSGHLSQIAYGPHRSLSLCKIERDVDGDGPAQGMPADNLSEQIVRETLLDRGMWPAFRSRPFGRVPAPEARPAAVFVTATQLSPLAPDPHVVLVDKPEAFARGVSALTQLTDGPIHICQSRGPQLCAPSDQVRVTVFDGAMAAGLAGTHIDRLHELMSGQEVWTIGYQDVAAIGKLFLTGKYCAQRVVSVSGPRARHPRLIRTSMGANLHDIVADQSEVGDTTDRMIMMTGDEVTGYASAYLGQFDQQISLMTKPEMAGRSDWRSRLFARQGALIPTRAIERALAPDILPAPLLRALSVGDVDAAQRLGCLSLIEEDVALLTRACTSGADYGRLLRDVLDDLMKDAA